MGKKIKIYIYLHLMLMVYSISGVLGKFASSEKLFSITFFKYYIGILVILGFYALVWQQIIKSLPLTMAYANKAVSTVWGLLWGVIFFHEQVTSGKIIGIVLIISGIILLIRADERGLSSEL